jgi:hypothetical protein
LAGLRDAVECGMWLGRGGILVPQPLVFNCGRPPLQVIVNFVARLANPTVIGTKPITIAANTDAAGASAQIQRPKPMMLKEIR